MLVNAINNSAVRDIEVSNCFNVRENINMSIYKPTWLYIKQHNQTGLKYFGKTTKDPCRYTGSGKYWLRHLKKHGNDVTTTWCQLFDNEELITKYALQFSKENNIVESIEWANLIPENGLDGGGFLGVKRGPQSIEHKAKQSAAHKGKSNIKNKGRIIGLSPLRGIARTPLSEEQKAKISIAMLGKNKGRKLGSSWNKGVQSPYYGISQNKITCPHCFKVGGNSSMKRWHFNNCPIQPKGPIRRKGN